MTTTSANIQPQAAALTSLDIQAERLSQLRRLMPDLFDGEGKLDEPALRALTQPDASAPVSERFRFEWAGKHQSKCFAFTPSRGTLVADKARSIEFDSTQNLIIEGDNLEVLKLLQATYFERVKCIYIDPPYNTGKDFIYPDNFGESKKAYWQKNGTIKDGVKLTAVTESSGRRHSNWLNMMQARLLLARQLLRPDGVIFISIDDNEQANLKKLCDEVFGEENFITALVWEKGRKNDAKLLSVGHEYMLLYVKNKSFLSEKATLWREEKAGALKIQNHYLSLKEKHRQDFKAIEEELKGFYQSLPKDSPSKKHARYSRVDEHGIWRDDNMSWPGGGGPSYDVLHPVTGLPCAVPEGGWRYSKPEKMQDMIKAGKVVFREDHTQPPIKKTYLVKENNIEDEDTDDIGIQVAGSYFYRSALQASNELTSLLGGKYFQNPKDHEVLSRWIRYIGSNTDDEIILDFFAGSGATAQAAMNANLYDQGNRKYILVQVPEYTETSHPEAYQAGYKTISSLCIERVKRAGAKIREEQPDVAIDTGFRVFRLTDSHFSENLFTPDPDKTDAENRDALEAHLNAPRQQSIFAEAIFEDVVTELAIKNGYGLFYTLDRLADFADNAVYRLSGNDKAALLCLDETLQEATLEQLEVHSDEQLFCSRRALDTTKKWTLQAAFKDNLWVV